MIYIICFNLAILTLLFLISNSKVVDINILLLNMVVVIGNGGYYALYTSQNLSEAILANTLTYSIGCFAPMIMFILICNICRIDIKQYIQTALYLLQIIIFLSVCTVGKLPVFYKSVEYNMGETGAYLTKTYGPMHTVQIITLCIYMLACIAIVADSIIVKRCRVSRTKANMLLSLFLFSAVLYFVERFVKINVEVMPVIFTVTNFFVTLILVNISNYSAYGNLEILEDKKKDVAYIVFSNNLKYMSCNDYALELLPELSEWEIEKKISGSGGRFNTFLRVPFMEYVNNNKDDIFVSGFEYKDQYYRVEISRLGNRKKRGYVIEIALDIVKTREISQSFE